MVATDMIEQIRQLPNREAVRIYDYLFSEAGELDRLRAAFDRLPRKTKGNPQPPAWLYGLTAIPFLPMLPA